MSKHKEKHHSHGDSGSRTTDDRRQTPRDAGQAADLSRAARDDGRQTTDDGRRTTEDGGGTPDDGRRTTDGGPDKEDAGRQTTEIGRQTPPAEAADQVEKLAQLQDRFVRLQADFDNFRKRTLREKSDLFDSANQALMLELLPVLDHLQLGIQAASAHQADPSFREGLTMILDQLAGVLSKFGLSPIETEKQVFDPNRFEAVNALPSATEPEGAVLAAIRRGYMLRNKLLRPAQVIVSSGPPQEEMKNEECKMKNEE